MISTMILSPKTRKAETQEDSATDTSPADTQLDSSHTESVIKLRNIYWRKLIQEGIPSDHAKHVANGIANFDANQSLPTSAERQLIGHYCTFIARAQLWRLELLMGHRKS